VTEPLLDAAEVAELLGVPKAWVLARARGEDPAHQARPLRALQARVGRGVDLAE
jgi:hypothetical protein